MKTLKLILKELQEIKIILQIIASSLEREKCELDKKWRVGDLKTAVHLDPDEVFKMVMDVLSNDKKRGKYGR